jgi:hypothetical protein
VQAAEAAPGSRDRLLAVTGYAVSLYATIIRTDKPFKDLFGATYEYVDPVKGLRGFAEKVRPSLWQDAVQHCEMEQSNARDWHFCAIAC